MSKLDLGEEKKLEYGQWIKSVRAGLFPKVNQEQFGQMVYRFDLIDTEPGYKTFSRGAVKNWENGENLPKDKETLVSIALLEYDYIICNNFLHMGYDEKSNLKDKECKRLHHVQQRMNLYMERELYPRLLGDLLLLLAAKGLFRVNEIPQVRRKLDENFKEFCAKRSHDELFSLESVTGEVNQEILAIENMEQFERFLDKWQVMLYFGGRIVGERFKERVLEYYGKDVCFSHVIDIYAPRYRQTYLRLFSVDICVFRSWLIELCVRLRFTREMIQDTLKNAAMFTLSDDENHLESLIKDRYGSRIGSVRWLKTYSDSEHSSFRVCYPQAKELSTIHKFTQMILMLMVLMSTADITELSPVDYTLSYYLETGGKRKLEDVEKLVNSNTETMDKGTLEEKFNLLEDLLDEFRVYAEFSGKKTLLQFSYKEIELLCAYQNEFCDYFEVTLGCDMDIEEKDLCQKLTFWTAYTYSLFSGKLYTGDLDLDDLDYLCECIESEGEEFEDISTYIYNLCIIFLQKKRLLVKREASESKIYAKVKLGSNQVDSEAVSLTDIFNEINVEWRKMMSKSI